MELLESVSYPKLFPMLNKHQISISVATYITQWAKNKNEKKVQPRFGVKKNYYYYCIKVLELIFVPF